jgi:sugar-specific transcriptional regulator TrmB
MKLIVLFLFFEFSLFSQTLYILPDDYDNVIHYLSKAIDHADKKIIILTHTFDNYTLKKSLIKASKRHVAITLISASDDQKKSLALYQNIDTRELLAIQSGNTQGKIATTVILIDNILTCKLSSPLDSMQIKHDMGLFTCKEDKDNAHTIENAITPLLKRSKPYLEN